MVENASQFASRIGMSNFLVGVIIVGFGTSAPEMFVSAMAALENKGNLALGNALGSNITNIGLVLGSAALVRAIPVSRSATRIDIPVVILVGVVAIALILDGVLSRLDGTILLLLLFAYLFWSAKSSRNATVVGPISHPIILPISQDDGNKQKSTIVYFALTAGSIVLLMIASKLLVNGAVHIAQLLGVSELIIGLTIVAIGTSLPELAAAIAAARKGVHEMIIGNIIGSNIFNTLGVLGITGVIRTTQIETDALWRDFPVMFVMTILMLIFALTKRVFSRREGLFLVLAYCAYICYLLVAAIS